MPVSQIQGAEDTDADELPLNEKEIPVWGALDAIEQRRQGPLPHNCIPQDTDEGILVSTPARTTAGLHGAHRDK